MVQHLWMKELQPNASPLGENNYLVHIRKECLVVSPKKTVCAFVYFRVLVSNFYVYVFCFHTGPWLPLPSIDIETCR